MKTFLRNTILGILKVLAKIKLSKMNAKIIGVTGSVGKTSCKDVIFAVLSKKYAVMKNEKSYNSEFGLLLTILHQESGFSSPLEWLKILFKSFWRTFFVQDKYDYLILEMGVDKPGDMDFLTSVAPPDISLITAIKPVHLATGQFINTDAIFKEKKKMVENMKPGGTAFISLDDKYISHLKDRNNVITYSQQAHADVYADDFKQEEIGLEFIVSTKDDRFQVTAPLYGEYQLSLLLPAICIGLHTKVPINDIQDAVSVFKLPPGRMTLIEGIEDTLILDSSYNASPIAIKEALKVLNFFGKKRDTRRVFVFGNMNELGEFSKDLHFGVGEKIAENADILITVGEDVLYAADAANKYGMDWKNIKSFKSAKEAAEFYKKIIKKGDIILAKGSQNKVRLEIFVKEIMKRPEEAKETLVRQEKNWENIAP